MTVTDQHHWSNGQKPQTITIQKLSKIQRLAYLGITVVMKTTSTAGLEALIAFPLLNLKLRRKDNVGIQRRLRI